MVLLPRKPKTWPYAADSVGPLRGHLNIGGKLGNFQGSLQCFEACGSARAEFDKFIEDIKHHLENHISRAPNKEIVISLFMLGKQAGRTKPYVLISSDDKPLRKEAFRSLRDESSIMQSHPGFELGHIPLSSEFTNLKNLQALADNAASPISEAGPSVVAAYDGLGSTRAKFGSSSVSPESQIDVETTNSSVYILASRSGNATSPKIIIREPGNEGGKSRSATAGGILSYKGLLMFHTVNHVLDGLKDRDDLDAFHQETVSEADSTDCEITGWSDFEDEENEIDLADITSQGSISPDSELDESVTSATFADESSTVSSEFNHIQHAVALRSNLCRFDQNNSTIIETGEAVHIGQAIASSRELDSMLVGVHPSALAKLGIDAPEFERDAIPLENYQDYIETAPYDAAIRASTPEAGTVGGALSGTPSLFCLPGSKTFVKVYTAKMNQPLVPGDCGSWIRDAVSGKIFGHVIAGSPSTGLVIIIPAQCVLSEALRSLNYPDRSASNAENICSSEPLETNSWDLTTIEGLRPTMHSQPSNINIDQDSCTQLLLMLPESSLHSLSKHDLRIKTAYGYFETTTWIRLGIEQILDQGLTQNILLQNNPSFQGHKDSDITFSTHKDRCAIDPQTKDSLIPGTSGHLIISDTELRRKNLAKFLWGDQAVHLSLSDFGLRHLGRNEHCNRYRGRFSDAHIRAGQPWRTQTNALYTAQHAATVTSDDSRTTRRCSKRPLTNHQSRIHDMHSHCEWSSRKKECRIAADSRLEGTAYNSEILSTDAFKEASPERWYLTLHSMLASGTRLDATIIEWYSTLRQQNFKRLQSLPPWAIPIPAKGSMSDDGPTKLETQNSQNFGSTDAENCGYMSLTGSENDEDASDRHHRFVVGVHDLCANAFNCNRHDRYCYRAVDAQWGHELPSQSDESLRSDASESSDQNKSTASG